MPPEGAGTDPGDALRAEEERLRRTLADLEAQMARLVESSRGDNADDEHDPEGQTIAFERSQLAAVRAETDGRLGEVRAAAARLADGTYGRCEVCGRSIPDGRLEARPTATTCVQHAARR